MLANLDLNAHYTEVDMMRLAIRALIGVTVILSVQLGSAEQSDSFGEYTVYCNAFITSLLDSTVARTYNIIRSSNRALVNVAVLRKVMRTTGQPLKAMVTITATNLNSQLREVEVREINDAGGIYYIGEVPVNDQETLNFTVVVTPEGEIDPHMITFQQQFFADSATSD